MQPLRWNCSRTPGLGMALVASAYELAKHLLTWEVTSTYDFAEKVIKYQRSSLEKLTEATAR